MASAGGYNDAISLDAPFPPSIPICDPHFHVWDNVSNPKNLNLGGIADGPLGVYVTSHYMAGAGSLPIEAVVHVETVVGQDGSFDIDSVAETRFVARDTAALANATRVGVVAFVDLTKSVDEVVAALDAHAAAAVAPSQFVGVRFILNFDADDKTVTWPQVARDFLAEPGGFTEGFRELSKRGLTFDLHANPAQLYDAAEFLLIAPPTRVVVDHLGCPKLGQGADADAKTIATWKYGMRALARVPGVHVKISGLCYIRSGWLVPRSDARTAVEDLVAFVLSEFGAARCMVASNFPVDLHVDGADMPALYAGLHAILAPRLDREQLKAVFCDNAISFYGLLVDE
jgi:predicted TIM-barrel fold metal-dependent hydrolase